MLIRSKSELPNYGNVSDYLKFLKQFPLTNKMYVGRFYSFNYKFSLDYKYDILKFFDWSPIIFCFDIWENGCIGTNLHHLALEGRWGWWHNLLKFSRKMGDELSYIDITNKRLYKVQNLNYPRVYKIFKKSKIGIRKYRWDRMTNIRPIPLYQISEDVMDWVARTYFAVTYRAIKNRYNRTIVTK